MSTKEQSPTNPMPPVSTTPAPSEAAKPMPKIELPFNYLSSGYLKGTEKARYPDPALTEAAETIARALAQGGMKYSNFNKISRTLRHVKSSSYPLEAKISALKRTLPMALYFVQKNNAPQLLVDFLSKHIQSLHDEKEYGVLLEHFEAIGCYLKIAESPSPAPDREV